MDRWVKKLPIELSTFVQQDITDFMTNPADAGIFAPPVPTSGVNATQVHDDVKPDGYYPTATKGHD